MWADFEWENKLTVSPMSISADTFLTKLMEGTGMIPVGADQVEFWDGNNSSDPLDRLKETWALDCPGTLALDPDALRKVPGLHSLFENSSFIAVNLYCRSVFGEDVLANVSLERLADGRLSGNIRIRSRSQGTALSFGDRVSAVQRSLQYRSVCV